MMNLKKQIVVIALMLLMASCGTSKNIYVIKDKKEIKNNFGESVYDEKARLSYSITKDNDFLYI